MLTFSKAMSFELAPDNILINCVCPVLIRTPLWETLTDQMVPTMGKNRQAVLQNLANQFLPSNALVGWKRCRAWWPFWRLIAPLSPLGASTTWMVGCRSLFKHPTHRRVQDSNETGRTKSLGPILVGQASCISLSVVDADALVTATSQSIVALYRGFLNDLS
jgi:hypothetical protein